MCKYNNESIYIAGPECFYPNGYDLWDAMGKQAEYYGFGVVMPTKNELKLDHEDLRKNADAIFTNCAKAMNEATVIIADLEQFRGSEPDGGSLFEIGMAYARGLRCYGFTRDKREMLFKYQYVTLRDGKAYDADGRVLPYQDLPFCPSLVGSCKLIEGGFGDCLKLLMLDIDEERKASAKRQPPAMDHSAEVTTAKPGRPVAYLALRERYDVDASEKCVRMKELCEKHGILAVTPMDAAPGVPDVQSDDAYTKAYNTFDRWQRHVRECDMIIADLNDFHGWEPNGDVAFECGMAWRLGKQCFGYMDDTRIMRERIPNLGPAGDYLDLYGNVVENFDYPINLMFASSMPVFNGSFEQVIEQVAQRCVCQ